MNKKPLEPLDLVERHYDTVMADPTATYDQRLDAVVRLCCRAYCNFKDAEHVIQGWIAEHPRPTC